MKSDQSSEQTLTEALAENVTGLRMEKIPEPALEHARLAILDTVGAGLLGPSTQEGQRLLATVRDIGAIGQATLWGTRFCTTAPTAALVNGTFAHALELDDFGGCGHSGAVVVPAALAIAEEQDSSGEELLVAVVAGYDVAARITIGAGGYFAHNDRGWHSTGTCGTFGAAAAAARLLSLDAAATTSAMGIAGSYTGGIWAFLVDGAMTKRLHPGKAAENGVVAGYLARRGFTGPRYILEAKWGGFFSTYMPGGAHPEVVTKDLGSTFEIRRSGFKPHASCRGTHGALDSLLQLVQEYHLTENDVERIQVITSVYGQRQLGKQEVNNVLDAQLSMPYGLAVALLSGATGWSQYREERLFDPKVREWCYRVDVIGDERVGKTDPDLVRVRRTDGSWLERSVRFARGAPENPMTKEELLEKFREVAGSVLQPGALSRLSQMILNLEELPNVREMTALLRQADGSPLSSVQAPLVKFTDVGNS